MKIHRGRWKKDTNYMEKRNKMRLNNFTERNTEMLRANTNYADLR